jgi:hypothetical protein
MRTCGVCPGNRVFCIWQPCAIDSGNKTEDSAHVMGSGGLAVDAMAIGCLGVDRCGERFFVLNHFSDDLLGTTVCVECLIGKQKKPILFKVSVCVLLLQDLLANSTVRGITLSTQNCDQAGSQGPRPLPHMNLFLDFGGVIPR